MRVIKKAELTDADLLKLGEFLTGADGKNPRPPTTPSSGTSHTPYRQRPVTISLNSTKSWKT